MILDRVELKPLDQLREEGCEVETRKGEEGQGIVLIKTKDPSGRSVTFCINSTDGRLWPTYLRPFDDCMIVGEKMYGMFRHLFKD